MFCSVQNDVVLGIFTVISLQAGGRLGNIYHGLGELTGFTARSNRCTQSYRIGYGSSIQQQVFRTER